MLIETPTEIQSVAWEGELIAPESIKVAGSARQVSAQSWLCRADGNVSEFERVPGLEVKGLPGEMQEILEKLAEAVGDS